MDDPFVVCDFQGVRDLPGDRQRACERQPSRPSADDIGEGIAIDELENQEPDGRLP